MIDPSFQFHKLNDDGIKKAETIAESFTTLLNNLAPLCGSGRELAIVKTKLEEACFFAKKAMAVQQENQDLKVVR